MNESVKHDVRLYLDADTRKTFDIESKRVGLSFSAFLRVMGRIWREPADEMLTLSIEEFRKRVREIVEETERRV